MLKYARYLMPFGVQRIVRQPVSNARDLAPGDRDLAKSIGYRSESYFALYDEAAPLLEEDVAGELRLGVIPEVPLVVLASEGNIDENEDWRDLQTELAGLVPGGRLVVAEGSGHFIQVDRPDLVVDAVRSVLPEDQTRVP
jgi:pimeloyl-ACP methyl ester carboxylesterase